MTPLATQTIATNKQRITVLYSTSRRKSTPKYHGCFWPRENIEHLPASTQCGLEYHACKFCSRDFCWHHGRHQRELDCCRILAMGSPILQPYIFIGKIGFGIPSQLAIYIRNIFLKQCKAATDQFAWLWRWEWRDFCPHLNATIFFYAKSTNIKISSFWHNALKAAGHPCPTKARTYFKPCKNYEKWTNYMFKPYKQLGKSEAPPRVHGDHWSYWNKSDNFGKYLNGINLARGEVESLTAAKPL